MISFLDKEPRSEIQGTSPVAAKLTSSLTHDDQQPSSSTGKSLRNHSVVIRAVSNWHGLPWGKWASPHSSGHCRLHWQEHSGVSFKQQMRCQADGSTLWVCGWSRAPQMDHGWKCPEPCQGDVFQLGILWVFRCCLLRQTYYLNLIFRMTIP